MQYFAGLVVFSGISSFLISDTIDLVTELRKGNNPNRLYLDFFRLVILAGMALIGYIVAKQTFQQPKDWVVFLAIGAIAALLIYTLGIKQRASDAKGVRKL